jgi:hypothetical protein
MCGVGAQNKCKFRLIENTHTYTSIVTIKHFILEFYNVGYMTLQHVEIVYFFTHNVSNVGPMRFSTNVSTWDMTI